MSRGTSGLLYELAFRENDGLEVALLWDGAADRVLLSIRDVRAAEWFVCSVEGADALAAFRHPFAYAPHRLARAQRAAPGDVAPEARPAFRAY